MYIFELIVKKLLKNKKNTYTHDYNINIIENKTDEIEECEHLFLPIDSSNEYFTCKYCGLTINKEKFENNLKK